MNRTEILNQANELVNADRQSDYGKPDDNFQAIADFWRVYLLHHTRSNRYFIQPHDVALMMILLKIARTFYGDAKPDTFIDMAGYAALAGELHMPESDIPF
jgi:hypothetical protein